jgi:CheY-like chemotaxis protein
MEKKHVALLVEDEPEMAEEMGELLQSLGYDHIHAATQEEALALMLKGEFCFVLLDLQIKLNADSIRARVEAGRTLLQKMRERYPGRNARDYHLLPILVVSGQAKEHDDVVNTFKVGADDFIRKPLSDNREPIEVKISESLRKSGREHHVDCSSIMQNAQAGQENHEQGGSRTASSLCLAISGRKVKRRLELSIGETTGALQPAPFKILLHLVAAKLRKGEGWVYKTALGSTHEGGWQRMSRLREGLISLLPNDMDIIENNEMGRYRLTAEVHVGKIDCEELGKHHEEEIRRLATEIKSLLEIRQNNYPEK